MRAAFHWLAAAVVGVSACGGASGKPDGGGRVDGGGTDDGPGGTGGDGGGLTDGGGADLPLSTGDFPYPGRWWANLGANAADGGVADVQPFVIHWSATDPADRALWNLVEVLPMAVAPGPDGSTIVTHAARGTSGCWALYPTSDPDALDARSCSTPQSSSAPLLGTFRRGPQLVTQIPKPPLPAPDGTQPQVQISVSGIGGGGDWVVFGVGPRLWLWKKDTGQVFDLGAGGAYQARLSADGRRVMYGRATVAAQIPSLLVFDTATKDVTDLTALVPIAPAAQYTYVGIFAPDGSKVAFHANITIGGSYDLMLYDFATRKATTVAPHIIANAYGAEIFLASGNHLVYAGYDATLPVNNGAVLFYGYELSTGKRIGFGPSWDLVEIPGRAYAGFMTSADGLVLIDDATFTPRVIASLVSGGQYLGGGGLAPSPDGTEVAYVDPQGVLNVRNIASGTTTVVANGVGCLAVADPLSPTGSGRKRAVAALFAADGALVYNVGPGCGDGVYGLGRYDRTTRTEKTYAPIADDGRILAVSPFGGFVIDAAVLPTVLAWPGPPMMLDPVVPQEAFSQDATFVFSAADRYLTFTTNGFLMVRDNRSGTVTKVAESGPAQTFTNPVNGVTVGYAYASPLTAYLPDGTSWQVASRAYSLMANPTTTKVVYSGDGGLYVLPLEPGAKGTVIGNRFSLAVTDTQVLFQDLDGVCAAPL